MAGANALSTGGTRVDRRAARGIVSSATRAADRVGGGGETDVSCGLALAGVAGVVFAGAVAREG